MRGYFAVLLILLPNSSSAAEKAPQPKQSQPVTFTQIVQAAAVDSATLPPGKALTVRYLDAHALSVEHRRELYSVLAYHVNSLSREHKKIPPRKVTEWLWAVDLDDYRWDAKVWEGLAKVNYYYAIKVDVQQAVTKQVKKTITEKVQKQRQVLHYDQYGRGSYVTETYYEDETKEVVETVTEPVANLKGQFVPAPWLPAKEMATLTTLTGSVTPIFRADAFLYQTGAQADREGHGYYDFLGLGKKLEDAEKLATLDRKKAIEAYKEVAAVINSSGVALANRQLFRFSTVAGSWWESRDTKENTGNKNAVSNLLEDFKADAFEIVFSLPNGLPAFYLANDKGERQDTAPDFIAGDHRSTNNDRRVHVGYSCVACHTEGGLKPMRDYMRRVYTPETGLSLSTLAADSVKAKRLESVYLGPLEKSYKRDSGDFTEAIEEVSGLKPTALSKGYEARWSAYVDSPVTLETAAAECGLSPVEFQKSLRTYAKGKGVVDPVLAVYLVSDPPPVRREHFEERFGLLMLVLGGKGP